MLRITCPNCQCRLAAKEDLVGQTRNCPRCSKPILIAPDPAAPGASADQPLSLDNGPVAQHAEVPPGEPLGQTVHRPERIVRSHRYLILDRERVVATWENNGSGWMLRTGSGFVNVSRNQDKLPTQGTFVLVELRLAIASQGLRLHGIMTYRLANRWALPALARGDEAILRKVEGFGSLNQSQKFALFQHIRDQFMREVWANIPEVHDYLTNADYHSPGVDVPLDSQGTQPS
jgi:hypothetical protein